MRDLRKSLLPLAMLVAAVPVVSPAQQVKSLNFSPSTVEESDRVYATVRSESGGMTVSQSTTSPAARVPSSVLVPKGNKSYTFTLTTAAVPMKTIATITASGLFIAKLL